MLGAYYIISWKVFYLSLGLKPPGIQFCHSRLLFLKSSQFSIFPISSLGYRKAMRKKECTEKIVVPRNVAAVLLY